MIRRPMPEDFPQHAAVETGRALRIRYGVSHGLIERWIKESGVEPVRRPSVPLQRPAEFARFSGTMTVPQLAAKFGVGTSVAQRWRMELGGKKRVSKAVPDDFEANWRRMSIRALAAHYRRQCMTVVEWARELGLNRKDAPLRVCKPKPAKVAKPRVVRIVKPTKETTKPLKPNAFQNVPVDRVQRDMSAAGQAADYLRRFGPVYRCDWRGLPLADGFFWRRGTAILTDQDLIERADWLRGKEAA